MPVSCLFQDRFDPEKPYNVCIECTIRTSKNCDGPNPLAMTRARQCEFLKDTIIYNKHRDGGGWSYSSIAAKTDGVSVNTVNRIINDAEYDPGCFALSEVFRVVLDGSWGEYPCGIHSEDLDRFVYMDSPETLEKIEKLLLEIARLEREIEQLQKILDGIHSSYREEISTIHTSYQQERQIIRDECQKKIDFLKAECIEKNQMIKALLASRG